MSNEPIALGGGPIALGGSNPIALGPPSSNGNTSQQNGNADSKINGVEEKPKNTFRFADEVKIGDETVITIPVEHIFYEENNVKKRKSRWGDRPDLKKKVHQDVVFNPYQALTGGSHLLPITDGRDPTQIILGTGMLRDEEAKNNGEKIQGSKWGPEWEKTFQPPMYHNVPRGMTIDDIEYLIRLHRLDEITRNLNIGELEINDPDVRSPSPDPVYDKNGVRVNTRVTRAKDKLLREKNDLIEECSKLRKTFVPPAEYKPPKKSKKIFLPEALGPDNQYIGMVLGAKGGTQKALESKTGCKISIRGKGSSKQKRMEYDSDEKLHVLIQGDTDEAVDSGAQEVEKILRGDAVETTEAQKAKQLQVAAIGSALGDEYCINCSEPGHKSWNCPNKASFLRATVKCAICGDRSHPTSDCPNKKAQGTGFGMHYEYSKFMASLDTSKKPEARNAIQTTGFFTNTAGPALALTYGAGGMNYPQMTTFPAFGGPSVAPAPMMNTYTPPPQPVRPPPQHANPTNGTTSDSTITRPPAYTMAANPSVPYFINPMMMNYVPQNLQGGNQASNITIMSVNPNTPMGVTSMGAQNTGLQSGIPGYNPNSNLNMPNRNPPNFQGYPPPK